jgi:hypothetical protein
VQIYYSERLWVPASWWVIGMFFAVSFVSAVGLYAGPIVSAAASLVTAGCVAAALVAYGNYRIQVDADGLHAGRAVLDWASTGDAVALDREATGVRLGTGADPSGWLAIRGYVHEAVEVTLTDPDDPHPYWLVSTRRPAELVAAIERARAARAKGPEVSAS